jgi:hypothetical protein
MRGNEAVAVATYNLPHNGSGIEFAPLGAPDRIDTSSISRPTDTRDPPWIWRLYLISLRSLVMVSLSKQGSLNAVG